MKIVVAPDKFKGSLPATQVAAIVAAWRRAAPVPSRSRLAEELLFWRG